MAVVILPDMTLTTLTSNAHIKTMDNMNEILNLPWVFVSQHGQEVLELSAKLDQSEKDDQENATLSTPYLEPTLYPFGGLSLSSPC